MEYTTGSVRLKRHLRPADATEIIEEEAQPHTYRYAGFWMRFWAFIVDLLIITGLNGVLVSTWVPLIADGDSRWAFFLRRSSYYRVFFTLLFSFFTLR